MVEDNFFQIIKDIKVNLSEEIVLERLHDRLRWPKIYQHFNQPSIEAILEDGSKTQDFFCDDGYIDAEKCIKKYQEGYTLIFSQVGSFCRDTLLIQNILKEKFKKHVWCNFYLGNGRKSVSFKKHRHEYAVVVKNIFGQSKWIINEQPIILKNQEVIYFGKDIDHQVVEINNAKMSMTCSIDLWQN